MEYRTQEVDSDLVQEIAFVVDTTCNVCLAEFLDAEDLEVHLKQMHGTWNAGCQLCASTYVDQLDYAEHIRDHHLPGLRCCRYCTKVFTDKRYLKMHEKKHVSDTSLYSCSQCDAMYTSTRVLQQHERKLHNNDIDGLFLQCVPYLSSVLCLNSVKLLQTTHPKLYKCLCCGFKATELKIYNKHLNKKKCTVYVCEKCFIVCKDRKNIIRHIKHTKKCITSDDDTDKDVPCEECKRPIHPKVMKSHLKSCNKLRCVDCNAICQTIDELSAHQLREHPLDMDVIRCKFCQKEFIGKSPLKKHVNRVHKPSFHLYKYKCVDCNAIFNHPQKLFAHFFTQHKELEPFNCNICNKKFRVRKAFSLHIKLDHKSVGCVEFDDQYHVFFTANKSDKPFVPSCVIPAEDLRESDSEESELQKMKNVSIRSKTFIDTDATEAETEDDIKLIKRPPTKRKVKPKRTKVKILKKTKNESVNIYSSDEEPLMELRKRTVKGSKPRMWNWKKKNQSLYTCSVCNVYCYTYQNHKNHMSLHNGDKKIECVKCSRKFTTKHDLSAHMENDHATSKLTETLKNILQKRKQDVETVHEAASDDRTHDKFTITMRKVKMSKSDVPAKITQIDKDLSVRNFLENFTPEVTEAPKGAVVESAVTIRRYNSPYPRESIIRMNRFKDDRIDVPGALRMPQRFKDDNIIKAKVRIKIAEMTTPAPFEECAPPEYAADSDPDQSREEVPEAAHEVLLEGTEEPPKIQPNIHNLLLPKLPKGYNKIHIATLQPQPPYFKIIKVDTDSGSVNVEEQPPEPEEPHKDVINLPNGTKLVTVNPLAHLLGDRPLENVLEPVRSKYYKSRITNFQGVIAKAMRKLEEGPKSRKKKQSEQ